MVAQLALGLDTPRATALYFASGSNRPGEIRGFDAAGVHVGVAAPEVRAEAEAEILRTRGCVFVDSGAFSEVAFGARGEPPVVVAPMDEAAWRRVFDLYARLSVLGSRLYLVAPDRIGDQEVTLDRCARWAPQIRDLRGRGVRWIVPVQKGTRSMADFDRALTGVLGFDDYIRGVPSKKDATTAHDLAAFLRDARPRAVHLLGIGPTSPGYAGRIALCARAGIEVSCDSVAVRALSGRTNGRGGGPRALTSAQDAVREELEVEMWRGTDGMVPLDYTDAIACPEAWLSPAERAVVIRELRAVPGLGDVPRDVDLDAWLVTSDDGEEPWRYEHPSVALVLDAAWARLHERATAPEIKRRATSRVFAAPG